MKASQLAVILLIVCISSAVALKCNRCVPYSAGGSCTNTVETCSRNDDVCASVVSTFPRYSYFKRCMKRSDAFILQATPHFQVFTCTTDRCN
ncbi:long neurotoxin homolog NTL2-like [Lates japonicus]|uniref:Long neurotoxin homolog NTL2-like protein n=1 Tax=Lates japonicus TaxID=270547 RepID=A0AAD3RHC9_LATJO|nr:long neurotoxin homolog NTL2-like protein [Lates japonicus]